MEIIKQDPKNNKILNSSPELINSNITFNGANNILICEENVVLNGCDLIFNGNNSIIYLSSNYNHYRLYVNMFNNSVLFIDENNYFNSKLFMIISEEKSIFIGKDCLFAPGIWIRLADPHLIYDMATMERVNLTEDVYIGDHVWIAQESLLLKGAAIGSGSIIGAKSVISKEIESNSSWAGNPPKVIRNNVFFDGRSVHKYTKKETEQSMHYDSEEWIYSDINSGSGFELIREINNTENIDLKIEKVLELRNDKNKNRFYI
ncbi:acyltransferase [Methanobrevibacter sp.]|uniref:acyltransferase n=1 Tax=Methanobrevibacter sp. TaxID=66852 RepID=UPI0038905F69